MSECGQINVHPRVNTVILAIDEATLRPRNFHINSINKDGILAWRRTSGYYHQNEIKNMFFRYNKLIGDELRARNENPSNDGVCHRLKSTDE